MNRNEEYIQLLAALDTPVAAAAYTLTRAKARFTRHRWIYRPAAGFATVFVLFVLLVNFCTPVALACSKVPVLRELAEAVTFSRSLTDAVDNAYVQQIELEQTNNDITATVKYLIVDQKQVNVFFSLDSEIYNNMSAVAEVQQPDGSSLGCCWGLNNSEVPNGQLQSVTIDFIDDNVPASLRLALNIQDYGAWQTAEPLPPPTMAEDTLLTEYSLNAPHYVARFDFLLEFDPEFTVTGKTLAIDQTVELDGQKITLTTIEVYPTHLRLNVADNPGNTAWLKRLDFRIETDRGMTFDTVRSGITATGSLDSPMMVSYRANSPYFYDAKHMKVMITGAEWLDKDMETIHLNLEAGTAERIPDGVEIIEVVRLGDSWTIAIKAAANDKTTFYQVFVSAYYDAEGNKYNIDSWTSSSSYGGYAETEGYFYEVFALKDYLYDEVWLTPSFSHRWTASEPFTVMVQ